MGESGGQTEIPTPVIFKKQASHGQKLGPDLALPVQDSSRLNHT